MIRFLPLLIASLLLLGCQSDAEQATAAAAPSAPAERPSAPPIPADSLTSFYEIETPQGRMVLRLYDETPLHRDNFRQLVRTAFYDSTTFHRIIAGFMIQGGDPNTKDDNPMNDGQGGPGYTLPGEFARGLIHKRGAVAAARQGDQVNPQRRSSGSQFYIVQGSTVPDSLLTFAEQQIGQAIGDPSFSYTEEERAIYTTLGGHPPLDMQYTVFGEIVEGLDVLERLSLTPTPNLVGQRAHPALADRPLEPVWMVVRPLLDYEAPTP